MFDIKNVDKKVICVNTWDDAKKLDLELRDSYLVINGEVLASKYPTRKATFIIMSLIFSSKKRDVDILVINPIGNKLDKCILVCQSKGKK
jgi:hypothetical protein